MTGRSLKICFVASELAPLAKTGGLADVAAALAAFLQRDGHDVRVLVPFYSCMDTAGVEITPIDALQNRSMRLGEHHLNYSIEFARLPDRGPCVHLLHCPALYDRPTIYTRDADEHRRFILLVRAAIEMCQFQGFAPDVFHCHDWHTALVPLYLETRYAWDRLFANCRSVLTVHNIAFQGQFSAEQLADLDLEDHRERLPQEDLQAGRINFLRAGLLYADRVTTVSPTYAREILTPEYGMGMEAMLQHRRDRLVGILNGIDTRVWNPQHDPWIPYRYSADALDGKARTKDALLRELGLQRADDLPLVGMVSRLTGQKGIDLMENVVPALLHRGRFALAVLGSGEPHYERFFEMLQQQFPERMCFYRGYNEALAHRIEAGSDMFLMPSRFEPCGLNQMYSLRYGTVPVVRRTGGLADSVTPYDRDTGRGTGIVFEDFDAAALDWALNAALHLYADREAWRRLVHNGMAEDFSWDRQGREYVSLFQRLVAAAG